MTEFTILMPCLNEANALLFCIEEARKAIHQFGLEAEILIADNGSTDGSPDIARQDGVRVISVEKRGYGAAIIGGIHAAHGKYIILGDADGSYDFSNLMDFVNALRDGNALVVGNRFLGGIEPGAMSLSHWLGVHFLSAIAGWRFHVQQIGDFHCGLRAFDREKALDLHLQCSGMEFATELIARFGENSDRVTQVPVLLRQDKRGGSSHLRTVRDGLRHLYFIVFSRPPA